MDLDASDTSEGIRNEIINRNHLFHAIFFLRIYQLYLDSSAEEGLSSMFQPRPDTSEAILFDTDLPAEHNV